MKKVYLIELGQNQVIYLISTKIVYQEEFPEFYQIIYVF